MLLYNSFEIAGLDLHRFFLLASSSLQYSSFVDLVEFINGSLSFGDIKLDLNSGDRNRSGSLSEAILFEHFSFDLVKLVSYIFEPLHLLTFDVLIDCF